MRTKNGLTTKFPSQIFSDEEDCSPKRRMITLRGVIRRCLSDFKLPAWFSQGLQCIKLKTLQADPKIQPMILVGMLNFGRRRVYWPQNRRDENPDRLLQPVLILPKIRTSSDYIDPGGRINPLFIVLPVLGAEPGFRTQSLRPALQLPLALFFGNRPPRKKLEPTAKGVLDDMF